jgi:hypothetical protein
MTAGLRFRHGRSWLGHAHPSVPDAAKSWVAGPSPTMTLLTAPAVAHFERPAVARFERPAPPGTRVRG